MPKDAVISALKPHLSPIMDKLIIANAGEYGGVQNPNASSVAAFSQIVAAKARTTGSHPLIANDWLNLGQDLYEKRFTAKPGSINAVCDTLCAYAIYVVNNFIGFHGRFELFRCPAPTKHHFVVIDRDAGSEPNVSTTWGGNCFVIDLWHAKLTRTVTSRSLFSSAHHWKHGIFRNPSEHIYSGTRFTKGDCSAPMNARNWL